MKLKLLSIIILCSVQTLLSQEKFEKEYRVKVKDVPKNALQIIKMWNFPKKVKWYAEESNIGKTFEAKSCLNSQKVSVEFSENGSLLDTEVTVTFSKMPKDLQQMIRKKLSDKFKKFRIKKIQIQYVGDESNVYKQVFQLKTMYPIKPNYEIIVKGKKDKKMETFEILINDKGQILKELKVKKSLSLNLEF